MQCTIFDWDKNNWFICNNNDKNYWELDKIGTELKLG